MEGELVKKDKKWKFIYLVKILPLNTKKRCSNKVKRCESCAELLVQDQDRLC